MERIELETWGAREVARLLTLVENEKRYYQELLASLPLPLAVLSAELRVLSVNRAFRRRFAAAEFELHLGAGDLRAAILEAAHSGAERDASVHLGETRFHATILPFFDQFSDTGRCTLLVLRHETEPAPDPLESLPAVVWTSDASGAAAVLENLSGEDAAQWRDRALPADAPRVAKAFLRARESGQMAAVDYRSAGAEGAIRWLCDRIQPAPAAETPLRVLTTDETERILSAALLAQTRKIDAIARMSSRLAHEFNNILTVITGNADLLLASLPLGSPKRAELHQILSAAERAAEIGNRLRAVGRPPGPRPELFDLNDFLNRSTAGADLHLSSGPAFVSADRGQLTQALRALATWAAEHLPPATGLNLRTGVRFIRGDYSPALLPGAYVSLELGPLTGLAENDVDQWLEPFAAINAAAGVDRVLAAQSLVLMKAHVFLEPIDEFHRIVVLFPQVGQAPPKLPAQTTHTILIVDDVNEVRSLLARLLAEKGYSVIEAASGPQALELARSHAGPIHMLISDVGMTPIPGPDLARAIRKLHPAVRTIFISGRSDDPRLAQVDLSEREAFLPKPFKSAMLLDLIARMLSGSATGL